MDRFTQLGVTATVLALCAAGCMPTVSRADQLVGQDRPGAGNTRLMVFLPAATRPHCDREILGIVRHSAPAADQARLLATIRDEAAAMGGDRVVDVEVKWHGRDRVQLSGMAARCTQLLVARSYLPVRRLSVSAPAGQHRQALAALADEARALRAGLLVKVDYEEAAHPGGQLRMSAVAARYVPRWWVWGPYSGPGGSAAYGEGAGTPVGPQRRRPPAKTPPVDCSDPEATDDKGRPRPPGLHNCKVRF